MTFWVYKHVIYRWKRVPELIRESDAMDHDSASFVNYAHLIICIISASLGLKLTFWVDRHVIYRWKHILQLIRENYDVDDDSALFLNYAHLIICIISALLGLKLTFWVDRHVIYCWKHVLELIRENDDMDDDSALFVNYAHLIIRIIRPKMDFFGR